MDILDILAEDVKMVIYRPSLREITGSVNAAILLSQMLYYAKISDNNFYKFKLPCKHRLYKEGDSWCEELGFSKTEFETALKALKELDFVSTKTTIDRLTFYSVKYDEINKALVNIKPRFTKILNPDLRKSQTDIYENIKTGSTKILKQDLEHISENYTENYSENLNLRDEKISSRQNENLNSDETKKEKSKLAKNKTQDFSTIELPEFIDRELWVDFCAHRKAKRAPLTDIAVKRLLADFEKWHADGIDCNAAINETLKNGYQGIFKPKEQAISTRGGYRRGGEASADVLKRARELSEQMDALGDSGFYSLENQNDDEILLVEEIK